jgi:hypothetical protein
VHITIVPTNDHAATTTTTTTTTTITGWVDGRLGCQVGQRQSSRLFIIIIIVTTAAAIGVIGVVIINHLWCEAACCFPRRKRQRWGR